MLLSLADAFRCPADHEETALVLSVDAWRGPRVERGLLGCPVCQARYPIADAVVDFRSGRGAVPEPPAEPVTPDEAARVQALLNLAEPGGVILLAGRYAAAAAPLAELAEAVCLVVGHAGAHGNCVGILVDERLPLAAGSLRAAAADEQGRPVTFPRELARVVRGGGRILWGGDSFPAEGVEVLAQGDGEWVGQAVAVPTVVSLRRPGR